MAKNWKWIGIGCGGCLSVVLAIVLLVSLFTYRTVTHYTGVAAQIEETDKQLNALNAQYPFTKPEDKSIAEERFGQFLEARASLSQLTAREFSWAIQLSGEKEGEGPGILAIVGNLMKIPGQIAVIMGAQVEQLEKIEMSPDEYAFITGIMAAEIYSWRNREDELKQYSDQYFDIMARFKEKTDQWKKNDPDNNIQIGPFDYDEFRFRLKDFADSSHINQGMIAERIEAIHAEPSSVLLDAVMTQ